MAVAPGRQRIRGRGDGLLVQAAGRVSLVQRPAHGADGRTSRRPCPPAGARATVGDFSAQAKPPTLAVTGSAVRRRTWIVAIEVKLSQSVGDDDVRHLRWLAGKIGPDLLDAVVVTTGGDAYRRADGIAVVPAGALGP